MQIRNRVLWRLSSIILLLFSPVTSRGFAGDALQSKEDLLASIPTSVTALMIYGGDLHALAISSDHKTLAIARGHFVQIIDTASGNCALVMSDGESQDVCAVAFSHDGSRLATCAGSMISLWNPASGDLLRTFKGHAQPISSVEFSPDDTKLLTGSWDQTARLWDVASGRALAVLRGHTERLSAASFSANGRYCATASFDKKAMLWDLTTSRCLNTFSCKDDLKSVACSPDGNRVAATSGEYAAYIWDSKTAKTIHAFSAAAFSLLSDRLSPDKAATSVKFSSNGTSIYIGLYSGELIERDLARGTVIRTINSHSNDRIFEHKNPGHCPICLISDDRAYVVNAGEDGVVRVWRAGDAQVGQSLGGHGSHKVESIGVSHNLGTIAVGTNGCSVFLWDLEHAKPAGTLNYPDHSSAEWPIEAVGYSSDDSQLLCGSMDGGARLWDLKTKKMLGVVPGGKNGIRHGMASDFGNIMVLADGRHDVRIYIFDRKGITEPFVPQKGDATDVRAAVSGNIEWLACIGSIFPDYDEELDIWNVHSGDCLRVANLGRTVDDISFSGDGKCYLTGWQGDRARLWETASGSVKGEFKSDLRVKRGEERRQGVISSLALSPNGRIGAIGLADGRITIYDFRTSTTVQTVNAHTGPVKFLQFTSSGVGLFSTGADNVIVFWSMPKTAWNGQLK